MSRDPLPHDDRIASEAGPEKSFWERCEKFPPEIETAYQHEMELVRKQRVRRTGLVAVLLYSAFAISDRMMVPDAYQQAWAIRFLLVVPLLLFCTFHAYRLHSIAARDALMSLAIVVSGVSIPWIASLSSHPNAAHYQSGMTLIVLFGNIVLRLRLRSAVIASGLMAVVYGAALNMVDGMAAAPRFTNWLFFLSAVIISLIANFRMEQDQRRAYLARLREQERNQELSQAVALLERISSEDSLTKVANRREFERRLNIEWGRARREGQPLALVMIDVDCFKSYNDHYGHLAGDASLQQIAAALRAIPQRAADLVARYGGEEFIALLPAIDANNAALVAENMRQAILDLQIPHAVSRVAPGVTASFGVAAMRPGSGDQPQALIAAADAAVYAAKEKGRNRVEVWQPGRPPPRAAGPVH